MVNFSRTSVTFFQHKDSSIQKEYLEIPYSYDIPSHPYVDLKLKFRNFSKNYGA
jgi:hypothetical protein